MIEFTRGEAVKNRVSVRTELADRLPLVRGDRVQLQQVILNLVMNGIEAMQSVEDRPRELVIRSVQDETQQVLVSVTDCGVGFSAENADRLFNAFFTTKSSGMGMGFRSAVRSSKPTVAGCGPRQTYPTVRLFSLPCRRTQMRSGELAFVRIHKTSNSPSPMRAVKFPATCALVENHQRRKSRCSIGVVGSLPVIPDTLTYERLPGIAFLMVAARDHALASYKGKIPKEVLGKHTQIVLTDRSDLSSGREFGVMSPTTWRLADLFAKHHFLLNGLGWGGMPLHAVRKDLEEGRLSCSPSKTCRRWLDSTDVGGVANEVAARARRPVVYRSPEANSRERR